MVQVGHHAIVDGEEGEVAPRGRLHDAEDVQRARAALAYGDGGRLGRPQAAVGRQRVAAAAGDQAEGRPHALCPVLSMKVALP